MREPNCNGGHNCNATSSHDLNHTVQKDSRGVLGMSFRFGPTSEILENIQYGGSSVVENWQPKKPFYRQRSVILRYCWPSLRLLWLLKSSWSCIVSNPFINVLSICLVPLAGITEENSTVQRDILNHGNICWHVHHLSLSLLNCVVELDFCRFLQA